MSNALEQLKRALAAHHAKGRRKSKGAKPAKKTPTATKKGGKKRAGSSALEQRFAALEDRLSRVLNRPAPKARSARSGAGRRSRSDAQKAATARMLAAKGTKPRKSGKKGAKRSGPKKPRSAAQKAATARMLAARKAKQRK